MAEHKETTTAAIHHVPRQPVDNTITIRVPKPNMQVIVLGLVAFITLFQTFQLVRISANAAATPAKVAPATTTSTGSDVPQSMVGGC